MLKAKCGRASKALWDPQTRAGAAHSGGGALCACCRLCTDRRRGNTSCGAAAAAGGQETHPPRYGTEATGQETHRSRLVAAGRQESKSRCPAHLGEEGRTPPHPHPQPCYLETAGSICTNPPTKTQETEGRRRAQGVEKAPALSPRAGRDDVERPSSPRVRRPSKLVKAIKPQCQETWKRPSRINTSRWPR